MITENISWNEPEKIPQELEEQIKNLTSESVIDTEEKAAATRAAVSFIVLQHLSKMLKAELEGNERGRKIFKAFEDIAARNLSTLVNTLPETD